MTCSFYINAFDHWIAYGLLAFVGGRMVWVGLPFGKKEGEACADDPKKDCRDLPTLVLLSVATSIDALAIGLSFAMISIDIVMPSVVIGVITFAVSLAGYYMGRAIGSKVKIELDLVGGLVLLGFGVKILVEHLV